jgi:hypothetical protein
VSPGGQTTHGTRAGILSDRPTLHSTSVACFADLSRLPCGAHDFGCTPRGALDSTCAMCGPDVPALPIVLLTSPSGYAGVTGIATTSAVAAVKGRTGGSSCQLSYDDHAGEEGLPASGRQTHPIDHFGVDLVIGALLRQHRPRRSELVSHHRRRICCLDRQQKLGCCPWPRWLQHRHWQVDF